MSDSVLQPAQASDSGLLARRTGVKRDKSAARRAFRRMIALVWPHRRAMTWGVLLGLGVALTYAASLGGLLPVLKVIIADHSFRSSIEHTAASTGGVAAAVLNALAAVFPAGVTPRDRLVTLVILLGALLFVNLLGNALRVASQYLVLYASHRTMMDLRRRMYRKALRVPVSQISGDVSSRVNQFLSDTREIFLGVTTLFGKVAREPLKALAVLGVALWLDARLTLVVLAIAPGAVGVLWFFGRRVRKATVRLLEGYGVMLSGLEETLRGVEAVKGFGREGHERRRMWRIERRMLTQLLRLAWIESIASPLIEVFGLLITAAGVVWLAARTFHGDMSPEQFMTMVALLAAMLDPVRKIANVYNMVQRAGAASTRVFEFLDEPEERNSPRAVALAGQTPRAVQFQQITFRYTPTQEPPALRELTLAVEPGECVAIVGPNGSGKSTLLKLLPRLIEPQAGRVLIDGADVRDISMRSLRMQVAVVSQRPTIFARTVFENIAYGLRQASAEQVRDAAERAYAAEFIEQFPAKYETVLGEHGASISGGQRQRLAIARAFLKPASVLIFDEATSEIDAESERKIHAALTELRREKTTFLIAHRHTVMDMAERIVVMDAGRIVDIGTHAELISRCALYIALYSAPA